MFDSFIRAVQGNFDHLMGVVRNTVNAHNLLVDDVEELQKLFGDGGADGPCGAIGPTGPAGPCGAAGPCGVAGACGAMGFCGAPGTGDISFPFFT